MAWALLFAACVFEVMWAVAMKSSEGFTRVWPTVVTLVASVLSFLLLAQAVRTVPVGTGYTVMNGIGVAGTVIFGILLFGESTNPVRLVCVGMILAGILGLRLTMET